MQHLPPVGTCDQNLKVQDIRSETYEWAGWGGGGDGVELLTTIVYKRSTVRQGRYSGRKSVGPFYDEV